MTATLVDPSQKDALNQRYLRHAAVLGSVDALYKLTKTMSDPAQKAPLLKAACDLSNEDAAAEGKAPGKETMYCGQYREVSAQAGPGWRDHAVGPARRARAEAGAGRHREREGAGPARPLRVPLQPHPVRVPRQVPAGDGGDRLPSGRCEPAGHAAGLPGLEGADEAVLPYFKRGCALKDQTCCVRVVNIEKALPVKLTWARMGCQVARETRPDRAEEACAAVKRLERSAQPKVEPVVKLKDGDAAAVLAMVKEKGKDLHGVDLSGKQLEGIDLSGVNLAQANLSAAELSKANFEGANLTGANLEKAATFGASFKGARLDDLKANGVKVFEFTGVTSVRNASFVGAGVGGTFTGCALSKVDFTNATFHQADLTNADLRGATLTRAGFAQGTFKGANFSSLRLKDVTLRSVDLGGANFNGATFEGGSVSQSTFKGADLRKTKLLKVDATNANFDGVDARETKWEEVDASDARFEQGDFASSRFKYVNVSRTNIGKARSFAQIIFDTCTGL